VPSIYIQTDNFWLSFDTEVKDVDGSCYTARVNIQHHSCLSPMLTMGVRHTVWTIRRPLGLYECMGNKRSDTERVRGGGVLTDHILTAAAVLQLSVTVT